MAEGERQQAEQGEADREAGDASGSGGPPARAGSSSPYSAPGAGAPDAAPSERAGFWQRFAAYLVDVVLLSIVLGLLAAALGARGANFFGLLLGIAYFGYFEGGEAGATPGKRLLSIRVSDANGGGPIGYPRAVIRYIGRILSGLAFLLGYLWMLWDDQKQTWHDKFATSIVVPSRD